MNIPPMPQSVLSGPVNGSASAGRGSGESAFGSVFESDAGDAGKAPASEARSARPQEASQSSRKSEKVGSEGARGGEADVRAATGDDAETTVEVEEAASDTGDEETAQDDTAETSDEEWESEVDMAEDDLSEQDEEVDVAEVRPVPRGSGFASAVQALMSLSDQASAGGGTGKVDLSEETSAVAEVSVDDGARLPRHHAETVLPATKGTDVQQVAGQENGEEVAADQKLAPKDAASGGKAAQSVAAAGLAGEGAGSKVSMTEGRMAGTGDALPRTGEAEPEVAVEEHARTVRNAAEEAPPKARQNQVGQLGARQAQAAANTSQSGTQLEQKDVSAETEAAGELPSEETTKVASTGQGRVEALAGARTEAGALAAQMGALRRAQGAEAASERRARYADAAREETVSATASASRRANVRAGLQSQVAAAKMTSATADDTSGASARVTSDMAPVAGEAEFSLHQSESSQSTTDARQPLNRPELARHVAAQIAQALPRGTTRSVDLQLEPQELGRVQLQISTDDLSVTLHVTAERPETSDLMRRNISALEESYRALGYEKIEISINGEQAGQSRSGFGQQTGQRGDAADSIGAVSETVSTATEQAAPLSNTPSPTGTSRDRVDIRL